MLEHIFSSLGRASIEPVLVLSIVVMMVWEMLRPFRSVAQKSVGLVATNLLLTALNHGMVVWMTPWLYIGCIALLGSGWQGLFSKWSMGFAGAFVITLLVTEFTTYWLHRMFHTVPALWRVHAVHHSDTAVDVTTARRHHPIEVLIGSAASMLVLLMLGPSLGVVMAYSLLHVVMAAFSHGNIALPNGVQRLLAFVLVTPNFHRLHHAPDPQYTNSNYGAVVPYFDWAFGTCKRLLPDQAQRLEYGLEYFRADEDSRIDRLIAMPFRTDFPSGR